MLRLFRNQNPYTVILLLLVAILLKLPLLSMAAFPTVEEHQVLWALLLKKIISVLGSGSYLLHFFSIANIWLQALFLNYIMNEFHLYNKRTYLPAYTYILLTSILTSWSSLSVEMMSNWLFLGIINLILHTYSDVNTRKVLFNIGFLFGMLVLFNLPYSLFLFFIAFSVAMLRTYKPAEWMVTLLGMATPVYLLVSLAYLTDNMYLFSKISSPEFSLSFMLAPELLIALGLLLLFSLSGFFRLMTQMNRMLFQIKKMWWVSLLFLLFAVCTTLGSFDQGAQIWMVVLIPASMLTSKIWYMPKPRWAPELLHLILIGAVVYLNYFFIK